MEKRPDGSPRWNGEYYGLALPQAYVSLGSQDLSLQVGHFYSVVGYEGVMAPTNFFYSKAYSYQFAGPFTQWGAQMNWNASQAWTVQLGLHNGWDALDRTSDSVGFISRIATTADRSKKLGINLPKQISNLRYFLESGCFSYRGEFVRSREFSHSKSSHIRLNHHICRLDADRIHIHVLHQVTPQYSMQY